MIEKTSESSTVPVFESSVQLDVELPPKLVAEMDEKLDEQNGDRDNDHAAIEPTLIRDVEMVEDASIQSFTDPICNILVVPTMLLTT